MGSSEVRLNNTGSGNSAGRGLAGGGATLATFIVEVTMGFGGGGGAAGRSSLYATIFSVMGYA